ncbi:uncharacterized protein LOC129870209 [Solanum dulcamara]|uniref:uncharacterized protein LOC129870209 n=1 Tax=Solanum dulcamara TaxID=45834 RepID=UPI00248605D9|nr:uncharacterized protein LOC129870209 [Solanum dulcamara]
MDQAIVGELGGLKMLIRQESRSTHFVHCFAHQLQLTLVAISNKCIQVGELVLLISNILNMLGASFKSVDNFQGSQKKYLREALDMDKVEMGRGLNQELDFIKASDTHWGSYYKSFENFISSFDSIVNVLDTLVINERITNNLNKSLQKKDQDIANAMILVKLQELNDRFNEVTSDLLNGVSCLNPIDSFSNFDINKIMRMTELYLDDFDGSNIRTLENQLVNYVIDVRDIDERFSNLGGLGELSRKLVETKKHLNYFPRSKLDAKTRQCIFVGYGIDEFSYRIYDPIEKKLVRSRDIVFMENQTIKNINKVEKLESSGSDDVVLLDQVPHTSVHDVSRLDNHGDAQNQIPDQHVDIDNNNDIVIDNSPTHEVVDESNIPLTRSIRQRIPSSCYSPNEYMLHTNEVNLSAMMRP